MTKADLVNIIADKAKLQHKQSETIVNLVFDMMINALKNNDRIEIRGFGSDRKSTRLNSSHVKRSRMPSSA